MTNQKKRSTFDEMLQDAPPEIIEKLESDPGFRTFVQKLLGGYDAGEGLHAEGVDGADMSSLQENMLAWETSVAAEEVAREKLRDLRARRRAAGLKARVHFVRMLEAAKEKGLTELATKVATLLAGFDESMRQEEEEDAAEAPPSRTLTSNN